ncbi:hypothetical protein [Streptomyces sp. NPDC051704]|uniref:hypothetical protein n=1 Tax=Streptomyces sp. NPDC051704 TaxID=3365671 RepID=UPI0037B6E143
MDCWPSSGSERGFPVFSSAVISVQTRRASATEAGGLFHGHVTSTCRERSPTSSAPPELEPAERAALDQGVAVRRGQVHTLHVTAATAAHRQLLAPCRPLDGGPGLSAVPAQRKAHREYLGPARSDVLGPAMLAGAGSAVLLQLGDRGFPGRGRRADPLVGRAVLARLLLRRAALITIRMTDRHEALT